MGLVLAACGGSNDGGPAEGLPRGSPPTTASGSSTTAPAGPRAAPRWETVTSFRGTGGTGSPAFEILPAAIQWRARWRCESGSLHVTTDPQPRRRRPLVEASCPGSGEGYSIVSGRVRLDVRAAGPWELTVDQQLDSPLEEPPLAGMTDDAVVGRGAFYDVEMKGKGTAVLYELGDGSRALRLEDFEVSANTDLFVWLSEARSPRTSADAVGSPYRQIGNLKSTVGTQNYLVPPDLPTDRVRSIVIWCAPVSIAYAAAELARV